MKYLVTACAMNKETRRKTGCVRVEEIDTDTNQLFAHCKTPLDVEEAYERFWAIGNSEDIVKVIGVVEKPERPPTYANLTWAELADAIATMTYHDQQKPITCSILDEKDAIIGKGASLRTRISYYLVFKRG